MRALDTGGSDRGYLIQSSLHPLPSLPHHFSLSLYLSLCPPLLSLSVIFFFLWLSFPGFDYSSRVWRVCVCVCVCVCVSCICMAGALWIKEQKLLTLHCSSSDTRLQKDDNIENKLMNSQTHTHTHTHTHRHTRTRAHTHPDLSLKISPANLLEFG